MLNHRALSLSLCVIFLTGCPEEAPFKPTDLSRPDMPASTGDMSMKMYTDATAHAIDTNMAGGLFSDGIAVKLSGVVVLAPVDKFFSRSQSTCFYKTWVQDAVCATPPCGIAVTARGPMLPGMDAGSGSCPLPSASTTPLANVNVGDNIDVSGVIDIFTNIPAADMGATRVAEHEVEIDAVAPSSARATITPLTVVGDVFTRLNSPGWATYEGTLVRVTAPGGGQLTFSAKDVAAPFLLHTTPGNADWDDAFFFAFREDGGMTFPAGRAFTSVTAVVSASFGGALMPRFMSDFVP